LLEACHSFDLSQSTVHGTSGCALSALVHTTRDSCHSSTAIIGTSCSFPMAIEFVGLKIFLFQHDVPTKGKIRLPAVLIAVSCIYVLSTEHVAKLEGGDSGIFFSLARDFQGWSLMVKSRSVVLVLS
jgi:hypothetical protein